MGVVKKYESSPKEWVKTSGVKGSRGPGFQGASEVIVLKNCFLYHLTPIAVIPVKTGIQPF